MDGLPSTIIGDKISPSAFPFFRKQMIIYWKTISDLVIGWIVIFFVSVIALVIGYIAIRLIFHAWLTTKQHFKEEGGKDHDEKRET